MGAAIAVGHQTTSPLRVNEQEFWCSIVLVLVGVYTYLSSELSGTQRLSPASLYAAASRHRSSTEHAAQREKLLSVQ